MAEKPKSNALPEKLYGADLLARVKALQEKKKKPTIKEMARSCGYLHKETGSEQVTEFQRQLLIASGVIEYPADKSPEASEPLRVGALYKIYNAKTFLAQMGLKEGDRIEYKIRRTKNGPIAELSLLPKSPSQDAKNATEVTMPLLGTESTEEIDRSSENGLAKAFSLLPLAPNGTKELVAG